MSGEFRTSFVREPNNLRHNPALVLNADYRPLSYYPLSLWSWQEAVKAAWLDRVQILAEYDEVVRSPSTTIRIPSVVVLKEYVQPQKRVAFTRFNLFLRDQFCCQYCGTKGDLTFDHVVPPRTRRSNQLGKRCCGVFNLQLAQRLKVTSAGGHVIASLTKTTSRCRVAKSGAEISAKPPARDVA